MSENIFENNTEETPDLNFDVETPDITFDNIENGTPINVVSMDRHDEEDIDDLDEPDQYVDTVEENGDCEEENNAGKHTLGEMINAISLKFDETLELFIKTKLFISYRCWCDIEK